MSKSQEETSLTSEHAVELQSFMDEEELPKEIETESPQEQPAINLKTENTTPQSDGLIAHALYKLQNFWNIIQNALNAPITKASFDQDWIQKLKDKIHNAFGGGKN